MVPGRISSLLVNSNGCVRKSLVSAIKKKKYFLNYFELDLAIELSISPKLLLSFVPFVSALNFITIFYKR